MGLKYTRLVADLPISENREGSVVSNAGSELGGEGSKRSDSKGKNKNSF